MYPFSWSLKKSPMVSTRLITNTDKHVTFWPRLSRRQRSLKAGFHPVPWDQGIHQAPHWDNWIHLVHALTKSTSAGHWQVMAFKCLISPVDTKTHVIFKAFQRKNHFSQLDSLEKTDENTNDSKVLLQKSSKVLLVLSSTSPVIRLCRA